MNLNNKFFNNLENNLRKVNNLYKNVKILHQNNILFDDYILLNYYLSKISPKLLNNILAKLLKLRDNKINKIKFNNINYNIQFTIYKFCRLLGLHYTTFDKKWQKVSKSPIIKRYADANAKEILIYLIHTPKSGGMGIKNNLQKLDYIKNYEKKIGYYPRCFTIKSVKGFTIKIISGHIPARNYNKNIIKIGIVRQIDKRFISAFRYFVYGAQDTSHFHNEFRKGWINRLKKIKTPNNLLNNAKILKLITNYKTGVNIFYPLSYWLADNNGNCIVDYCIRQEYLQDDWINLCKILGIVDKNKLEKKNISKKNINDDNKLDIEKLYKIYPHDKKLYNFVIKNHKKMEIKLREKLYMKIKNFNL